MTTKLNDGLLSNALANIQGTKAPLSKTIIISSKTNDKPQTKIQEQNKDALVGIYLTEEEKEDLLRVCRFQRSSATQIGRKLIQEFLKGHKDILSKIKDLEKFQ